jgi:uncharacterized cupredoxin-like copper-binding protein
VILVVALVAASCGGGKPSGEQPGGPTSGAAVTVSEKEWTINLSSPTVKAGPVKLVIKNEGSIEHNFVIEGANVEVQAIQAGTSKEVTVTLKPGTYTVVCNIPGHQEAGMKTTLTVAQ